MHDVITPTPDQQFVFDKLKESAMRANIDAIFAFDRTKQDQNWLYIPVYVDGEDAFERVEKLQHIESEWRFQEPEPEWQVFLKPMTRKPGEPLYK